MTLLTRDLSFCRITTVCPRLPALGFFMRTEEDKNIFDPEVVIPKIKNGKKWIGQLIAKRKKLIFGLFLIILSLFVVNNKILRKSSVGSSNITKGISLKVDKSSDFPALTNQGKPINTTKIKFKVATAEKTSQVLVNDKVFTAKNNKMFLIVNLELKNDATSLVNILPGDLIRLTIDGDEENKFAPDLHNNLVPVAAISTKLDRIGFVIPQETRDFKLYVGELEGKKEQVSLNFPS